MSESGYWQRKLAARGVGRRTFLRSSALAGVGAAAFLAGCGSNSSTPTATATAAASGTGGATATAAAGGGASATAAATAAGPSGIYAVPAGKFGGTFKDQSIDPTVGWDPQASISYRMGYVVEPLSIKLIRHDYRNTPPFHLGAEDLVIGELAEKWESPDPTTYTFTLRKGIHWPDQAPANGAEMTAQDVAYTFTHALGPDAIVQTYVFAAIDSVSAIDDYTVQFKLKHPYWMFPYILDSYNTMILPNKIYDWAGTDGLKNPDKARGGGPWLLDNFQPGSLIRYKPNPAYKKAFGIPYPDQLDVKIAQTNAAMLQAFIGKQMFKLNIASGQMNTVKSSRPDAKLKPDVYMTTNTEAVFMNTSQKPFDDVRVRRAMSMAVDREGWGKTWQLPYKLESGPITWGYPDWKLALDKMPTSVNQYAAYNQAEAAKLMQAAGISSSTDYTMHMYPYNESYTPDAQLLIDAFQKVGMSVKLKVYEYNNWISTVYYGQYQDMMYGPDNLDRVEQQLVTRFIKGGNRNHSHVDDAQMQQWLSDFDAAGGAAAAKPISDKLQQRSVEQAYAIYKPQPTTPQAWDPSVQNYEGERSFYYQFMYRDAFLWLA